MLLKCTCSNEYQDKAHGKGVRVHNRCVGKTPKENRYRCTVCLNEKCTGGEGEPEKK